MKPLTAKDVERILGANDGMKRILTAGGAALFSAWTALAGWTVGRSLDEMTDETVLTLSVQGRRLDRSQVILGYQPTLCVVLRGDGSRPFETFRATPVLSIAWAKFAALDRAPVTVRFGKGTPSTYSCALTDERRAAVFPASVWQEMRTNDTMLVRFTRVRETVDDVRFDLRGLPAAVEEARSLLGGSADRPKPSPKGVR